MTLFLNSLRAERGEVKGKQANSSIKYKLLEV